MSSTSVQIRTENDVLPGHNGKGLKDPVLKSAVRRPLQVLQPSASTQTQLVGGDGVLRVAKPDAAKSKPEADCKPRAREDFDVAPAEKDVAAAAARPKPETRSIEVQTDLSSFSGDLDHAEQVAYMTSLCGSTEQMRKIAERYATEIDEVAAENAALKTSNEQLEVDNEKLRREKAEIMEMLAEAREIIAMVEPLLEPETSAEEAKPEVSAEEAKPEVSAVDDDAPQDPEGGN